MKPDLTPFLNTIVGSPRTSFLGLGVGALALAGYEAQPPWSIAIHIVAAATGLLLGFYAKDPSK